MSETQSEAERNPRGLVYIVRNDTHIADIYKVGQTYRSIEERLLELNRETSNPGIFEVKATFPVSDRHAAEREAHKKLKERGFHLKNEFFKGDWKMILQIVEEAQSKYEVKKIINPPVYSNEVEKEKELFTSNNSNLISNNSHLISAHQLSEKGEAWLYIFKFFCVFTIGIFLLLWLFG